MAVKALSPNHWTARELPIVPLWHAEVILKTFVKLINIFCYFSWILRCCFSSIPGYKVINSSMVSLVLYTFISYIYVSDPFGTYPSWGNLVRIPNGESSCPYTIYLKVCPFPIDLRWHPSHMPTFHIHPSLFLDLLFCSRGLSVHLCTGLRMAALPCFDIW